MVVSKLKVLGSNPALPTPAVLLIVLERVIPVFSRSAPHGSPAGCSVLLCLGALAPALAAHLHFDSPLASHIHLQTDVISPGVFRRQGRM